MQLKYTHKIYSVYIQEDLKCPVYLIHVQEVLNHFV